MAMTEQVPRPDQPTLERERWELLQQLQVSLEGPMTALGFVWLGLLILDLTVGLAPPLQLASNGIWALFVVDFVLSWSSRRASAGISVAIGSRRSRCYSPRSESCVPFGSFGCCARSERPARSACSAS